MNAVLIREGKNRGKWKNIGDFIQSIAQQQYWNHVDDYIDIEELSDVKSENQINVIMNGWFMWYPAKFPPASCINPLFVSFHVAPSIESSFFSRQTIDYLKKYEPIGTRDIKTMEMMEKYGIKSYYSGCLTLTLNKTYLQEKHGNAIYIVDPILSFSHKTSKIGYFFSFVTLTAYLATHYGKIKLLSRIFYHQTRTPLSKISKELDNLFKAADFYRTYSSSFSDEILFKAEYISQIVDNYVSVEEKFKMADARLRKYAMARLVITKRIHAALPCLALKTPVILTINDDIIANSPKVASDGGRFGGVLELFNYKMFRKKNVISEGCSEFITLNNIPNNPNRYIKYQKLLDSAVKEFVTCFE